MKPVRSKRCNTFGADRSGNVAVTFGLLLTILLLGTGAAVDIGRWHMAKSATLSALDAAVLAGGRSLQIDPENTTAALAAARRYYDENVRNRLTLRDDTVDFYVTDRNRSISARGSAHIDTTLLGLIGVDKLPVVSRNRAEMPKARVSGGDNGGSNLEIALMLDVTGSMCADGVGPCTGGQKLTGLKQSANDLIDIVVWADQSVRTSRVALIPFSTRLRVGPDGQGGAMMKSLTNLDPTWTGWYEVCTSGSGSGGSETSGNWQCYATASQHMVNWKVMPCVTDRFYDSTWSMDVTDDPPGPGRWLNAHGGDRRVIGIDSSETVPPDHVGLTSADPAWHWNYDYSGYCADVDPNNEYVPLTADKTLLKNRINGLSAYGATAGALGTAWSWYSLSPRWSSIFPVSSMAGSYSDVTAIQANGAPVLRKVAVLMSDGVYNTYRGWKEQDQQEVSNYAKQLCTNMKAQGIEIYTVGFALDQLPASERTIAEDTLRSCGTDVQHFYNTLNVGQLQQAFRDIALTLTSVYLSR